MKKILLCVLATMGVVSGWNHACAQANVAGTLYASNFNSWSVPQGNSGSYAWSSASVCRVSSNEATFLAFTVGTPVQIVDTGTPANSETVVPSAVQIGAGCSITVTPVNPHSSYYLASATAGLQEAINYASLFGTPAPAAVVILTPDWAQLGGTTSMITSAVGNYRVSILDERSSVLVPYVWNGTMYVAEPFGGAVTPCPQYTVPNYAGAGTTGTLGCTGMSYQAGLLTIASPYPGLALNANAGAQSYPYIQTQISGSALARNGYFQVAGDNTLSIYPLPTSTNPAIVIGGNGVQSTYQIQGHLFGIDGAGNYFSGAGLGHDGCITGSGGFFVFSGVPCSSSPFFGSIQSGTNTTASMIVSGTAKIQPDASAGAQVTANSFGSTSATIVLSGTATGAGQCPTTTSISAATWQNCGSGGGLTGVATFLPVFNSSTTAVSSPIYLPQSLVVTGNTVAGSAIISHLSTILNIVPGARQTVSGGSLPSGATILSYAGGTGVIVVDAAHVPTATATGVTLTITYLAAQPAVFPVPVSTQSLNGWQIASMNASTVTANDGIANLLASAPCVAIGCAIWADVNDSSADNRFPSGGYPDNTTLWDSRLGVDQHVYQNFAQQQQPRSLYYSMSKDQPFVTSNNIVMDNRSEVYTAPGANFGYGGDLTIGSPYETATMNETLGIWTAGLYTQRNENVNIFAPGDKNMDCNSGDWNFYWNGNWNGGGDEGLHCIDMHFNFAAPYIAQVVSNTGTTVLTLNNFTATAQGVPLAVDSQLIDTTFSPISANVTYSSTLTLPNGSHITTLTTDQTVPVDVIANLTAQANIQGVVIAATTPGGYASGSSYSGATQVSVVGSTATPTADASAITVAGDAVTVALINSSSVARTQTQVAALFQAYPPTTTDGGVLNAFVASGQPGTTAMTAFTATHLKGVIVAPSDTSAVTSFMVGAPTLSGSPVSFPAAGALLDMAGPEWVETCYPTSVTLVAGTNYAITCPLYRSHSPTTVYSHQSSSPGSGMAGTSMELNNYTALSGFRYMNYVLGSKTSGTVDVGTLKAGLLSPFGVGSTIPIQPATFYHSCIVRSVLNPANVQKIQNVNTSVDGTYLTCDATDAFNAGDQVVDTAAAAQNLLINARTFDVRDPFANFSLETNVFSGAGISGDILYNNSSPNLEAMYSDYSTAVSSQGLTIVAYSINGSSVGTFYYTATPKYESSVVPNQAVTLTSYATSTFLNGQTGNVIASAANAVSLTGTIAGSTITGVSVTSGYYAGDVITCTGTGSTLGSTTITGGVGTSTLSLSIAGVSGATSCTVSNTYFTLQLATTSPVGLTTEAGGFSVPIPSSQSPSIYGWDGAVSTFMPLTHYPSQAVVNLGSRYAWNPNVNSFAFLASGLLRQDFCNPQNVSTSWQITGSSAPYTVTFTGNFNLQSNATCPIRPGYGLAGSNFAESYLNGTANTFTIVSASSTTIVATMQSSYVAGPVGPVTEAGNLGVRFWQFGNTPLHSGSIYSEKFVGTLATPASSSALCATGQFQDDANYHYVCTATNTWKRVALTTF